MPLGGLSASSWGLGGVLGTSWEPLRGLLGLLETSWGLLGSSWGPLVPLPLPAAFRFRSENDERLTPAKGQLNFPFDI